MFAELAKALLEFLKLAPRYLVALGGIAAFLLFASEGVLKSLGLFELTRQYRPAVGITLLVCGFVCTTSLVIFLFNVVERWWAKRKDFNRIVKRLRNLTEDEKQILRYYYAAKTRANTLRMDDGVVQGLVEDGIIYRSAFLGNLVDGFAHNISDLVWDYMQLYPEILVGETDLARTDKKARRAVVSFRNRFNESLRLVAS